VLALVAVVALALAVLPRPRQPRTAATMLVAAFLLALMGSWHPISMQYIHYELLQNVVAVNLDVDVDKPYSDTFARKIAADYKPLEPVCTPGQSRRPNIIVLGVESLSMHHSQLFGGFRNLTPRLDAIAQAHSYIPDFIANGFTTDGGQIAMLTGQTPVPTIGRYQSADAFTGYADPRGAIPDLLHPYGYTAHFFTTADLGFIDTAKWVKGLHFDSWEGAEQPFYDGWKRHNFNAAEDKALYLRFLQWLDARADPAGPYFAFLMTVSSHPPFTNPETDLPDEPGVFRYTDRQIGMFYDELEKRGFFKNGILMISGDHRSMTPLMAPEQARFGDSALARTPFVLATDLPVVRGAIPGKFQQADIPTSIENMVGEQSCLSAAQGSFLRIPVAPAHFITHARGDKRNEVDVFFDQQQAQIVLDGDQSYWQGPKPADWKNIQDHILLDRIRRGSVDQNLLDKLIELLTPAPPAAAPAGKQN
jgi:phosphoglycerol transferase MdoB-like AlkP superfamily enzyme